MGNIIKHSFFVMVLSVLLFSCNGGKNDEIDMTEGPVTDTQGALDSSKINAQNVFNSIPPREQILKLIADSKAEYDYSLLNNPDPEVVNKYSVESAMALNLGVYGADLSIAGVYDQTQESMSFLGSVNILAKHLGVSSAFDKKMVDRMEANKGNRDSTLEIVSQSFRKADDFLKANGRPGTSSLIVAGLWTEGYYIALKTADVTKNEGIIKTIFEQKESLKYLIQLLEESKVSADVQYVITDLKDILSSIEAKTDNVFNLESLKALSAKTSALRKKIIAVS